MKQDFFDRFIKTKEFKKEEYRFFLVSNYIILITLIGHIIFIGIFFFLDVKIMSVINIFSCLIWIICFILNRRGFHRTAVFFGIAEIVGHAVLSAYFVGWACGFQYYIICSIPFLFFIPLKKSVVKILGSLLLSFIYLGMYYFSQKYSPVKTIKPLYIEILHYYNSAFLFLALAMTSFYYSRAVRNAEEALDIEYNRSESLLLNILPGPIAERLKESKQNMTIADKFDEVTVLFADIVGFTTLCSKINAEETVEILNNIFSVFDTLIEKYNLEKIKTIGDNYMLAGGLPVKSENHAENCADMALEMIDRLEKLNLGHDLKIRIGINTGPVVAGVIGMKKFVYDLWGDTVNTASRMESHGKPGKIHCSESCFKYLKDKYNFEKRGEIEVKGKGKMNTYFLVSKIK